MDPNTHTDSLEFMRNRSLCVGKTLGGLEDNLNKGKARVALRRLKCSCTRYIYISYSHKTQPAIPF